MFRGRKRVAPEPGKEVLTNTKYLCKACGDAWRVRAPAKEAG